jgi:hypothetical protein
VCSTSFTSKTDSRFPLSDPVNFQVHAFEIAVPFISSLRVRRGFFDCGAVWGFIRFFPVFASRGSKLLLIPPLKAQAGPVFFVCARERERKRDPLDELVCFAFRFQKEI